MPRSNRHEIAMSIDTPRTPAPPDAQKSLSHIDGTFRNGSITSIGVILAFSLGYLTKWAGNPLPWHLVDAVALVPMALGTALQALAFAQLLMPESLEIVRYRRCVRGFLSGLVLVAAGVGMAVILDSAVIAR
jgi:hypothetical protein